MKLSSAIVGTEAGPIEQVIDARWLMAYSAALGETDPRYFDTTVPAGVLAHPLFSVCYEWPLALALRERAGLMVVFGRVVHADHDLVVVRPPRAGDVLQVRARIVAVRNRKPGAYVLTRIEASDAAGAPVTRSDYGSLYRGVALEGADAGAVEELAAVAGEFEPVGEVAVPANAAHVYTECARIWNPIHTDLAQARAAGLPGIILHGTATLAFSLSRVLAALGIEPARVRRVRCRFSGMVPMPATLSVRVARDKDALRFEAWCGGQAVLSSGLLLQ